MSSIKYLCQLLLCIVLAACTPAYTQQSGKELASQARLTDSVDIQRSNPRLLSHQTQICLVSEITATDAGIALLRTMQSAFSGYFVAVGVENEPMDYLRALGNTSCPGANYLFFVQPVGQTTCSDNAHCSGANYSQFIITIINGGDRTLMDRVKFSIKKGFLPLNNNDANSLQKAFEQLAVALTGTF